MPETLPHATASEGFWSWLDDQDLSLAFTTYQTNRLFLVGRKQSQRLGVHERLFDKPMGLHARGNDLYMACRYQLWQLRNLLRPGETYQGCDRLYAPKASHITGDLNVHDLVVTASGKWLFVNTDFSCVSTLNPDYSFESVWQPPFISRLAPEDRCHLNGLAMRDDEPAFVTACSQTDTPAGWRDHRRAGGVVVHIESNDIVAGGLSMPHSPRWHRGKLWLLNSGTGELGYLDDSTFVAVAFCPGFARGLAFWNRYAVVGLSHLRSRPFSGLSLESRLLESGQTTTCGLLIVDLDTGNAVHSLTIETVVEELFDVVVLPGVKLPRAVGFREDEVQRLITIPGSDRLLVTKPRVKPEIHAAADSPTGLHFQQVLQLTPHNLFQYRSMTLPSLQQHLQTQPLRGELLGISATLDSTMIGLVVAELLPAGTGTTAETNVLSLFVLPEFRHLPIEQRLRHHLLDLAKQRCGSP